MIDQDEEIRNNDNFAAKEQIYKDMIQQVRTVNEQFVEENEKLIRAVLKLRTSLMLSYHCTTRFHNLAEGYQKTISEMNKIIEGDRKEYETRIARLEEEKAKMERDLQNLKMASNNVHVDNNNK